MAGSEAKLYQVAFDLIEACGDRARLQALLRANNLRSEGNDPDAAVWTRIADIVAELQRMPETSAAIH
jgi:hypothetical protein